MTRPTANARTATPASATLVGEGNRRGDSGDIAYHARRMALAGQVFGEVDVARAEAVHTAITKPDLDLATQRDDELAAGRRMPIDEVPGLGAAEHDANRVLQGGKLW